jgi:UDP-glucose 4-epimerase
MSREILRQGLRNMQKKRAMKNVLITGGNGFIGSHLVDRLALQEDIDVTVFDLYDRVYGSLPPHVHFVQGHLNNVNLIRRVLEDHNIQTVYHLAWASIIETSLKNVIADWEANIVPTLNLLDACCDYGVKRFIYLSSGGTVYGIPKKTPIPEDHPTCPISPYGVTKLAAEKYVKMYQYLYGLESVILRPSVPFGPRQNPHKRQGAISVFVYNALVGQPITLWGDGSRIVRDYFYISDLVEALFQMQNIQWNGEMLFNLGGGVPYSLNDVICSIQDTLGVTLAVQHEAPRAFDVPYLTLDISHAENTLGWTPATSIEQGIAHTADWILRTLL